MVSTRAGLTMNMSISSCERRTFSLNLLFIRDDLSSAKSSICMLSNLI